MKGNVWKRISAILLSGAVVLTSPSMTVLAEEMPVVEVIAEEEIELDETSVEEVTEETAVNETPVEEATEEIAAVDVVEMEEAETDVPAADTETEQVSAGAESISEEEDIVEEVTIMDDEIIIENEVIFEDAASAELQPLNATVSHSGTCGENVTWSLDSDGVLTISGTGAMGDYDVKESTDSVKPEYYTYRSDIKSIVIEEGVTGIGKYAFQYLSSATSVTFPSTLTTIRAGAFYTCAGLTEVVIPEHVTTLEDGGIFQDCYALKSVTLPSTMTGIPGGLFYGCRELTYVDIPDGVTSIGVNAFAGTALTSVQLPAGLTEIKRDAFEYADITEIVIPASVTSIGEEAFASCESLTDVYFYGDIPAGQYVFSTDTVTIHYLSGMEGWTEEKVKTLAGSDATITLKEWMTSSGTCGTGVNWVLNANGVLTISGSGKMADYQSSELNGDTTPWASLRDGILEVVIREGVTHVGDEAFARCKNLKKATIPTGVTSIGGETFSGCEKLAEVNIPDTVTEIGDFCFFTCKSLKEITLPSGLTGIADWTFYECSGLKKIEIPASVQSIGENAFFCCTDLAEVTFTEKSELEKIDALAFYGTGISEISIPDSVTSMGAHVFYDCHSLQSAELSEGMSTIPAFTFGYCEKLTGLVIPAGVTSIGEGALVASGLTSITIPAAVTEIGAAAFKDCTELTDIYFEGAKPAVSTVLEYDGTKDAWAFDNVTASIHYPYGGTGWSDTAPSDWGGTLTMIPEGTAGGNCGTSVTWTLGQNGEMLISGSGAMEDYDIAEGSQAPWYSIREDITKVSIEDTVTGIGAYAFYGCKNLREVTIGKGVTGIGVYAFGNCGSLNEIMIPASVTAIGSDSFRDSALTSILFKGNLPEITESSYAFAVNPALVEAVDIIYPGGNATWNGVTIDSLGGIPDDYSDIEYKFNSCTHSWVYETVNKSATCTEEGAKSYTCSVCETIKTETIPALGHSWNSGAVTTAAKCEVNGVKTFTCSNCKGTRTEGIAATGHTAGSWTTTKNPTCTAKGTKVQKCKTCSATLSTQSINAKGHSFGGWTTASEATVFAAKKEQRKCSCGTVETRAVGEKLTPTIELNATSIPLQVGQTTNKVKVSKLQNGDYVKSWHSNRESVVTVTNSGKITAKKKGKATLTVTLASGKTATLKVTVQKSAVKSKYITIVGYTEFTLERGKKLDLMKTAQPVVYPITSEYKLTFSSSNKNVATVNSKGVITAKKGGTAKITMKSGSAKKWTFTVTVPKIKTKAIKGIPKNLSIKKGKTYTFKTALSPKNSEEKVTYKSSKKSVVSVDSKGKLKAKKKGKAVITIKSGDVTVKCKVTVK